MAIIGGALKYVGKKVGGAVAKDVLQHEVERHAVGGPALAAGQFASQALTGRSLPGMKRRGSVIGNMGRAKGTLNNFNENYQSVRQGNIRERNNAMPMNKMSSVNHAYEDMIALKKEAADSLADTAKSHAVKMALTLGAAGAIGGAKKLYSNHQSENTWGKIVRDHPEFNTKEHRENFEVLKKFSPSIASNKTTARSYLQRAAHAGMMPHEFVKDLTAIEKTRDDSSLSGTLAKKASDKKHELRDLLNRFREIES
jgi:hypothetical protein